MRLAHISDTHLGFLAYGKTSEVRINQREVDVCLSFERCLDAIAERNPDVVIHSGDFFHVVRPSNYALIRGYKAIESLQRKRGGRPLVIIGGNHDTPQAAESANILRLFEGIDGVHVETEKARTAEFDGTTVLCVPHKALAAQEAVSFAPPSGAKHSILTLHGLIQGNLDQYEFSLEDTRYQEWAYVALGDWHVHQAFARNVCYAGSTDFTSTNIWEESSREKGWVWFDTEVGQLEFVPSPTRPVIDLPTIDASEMKGGELGEVMLARAVWADDPLPIVRQQVIGVHQETRRALPIEIVRRIEARALYYRLALQAPVATRADLGSTGESASLESSWERHVDATPMSASIDKARLKKLGLDLLEEVGEREAAPVEA